MKALYENKMSTTMVCCGCKEWEDKKGCKQKQDHKKCKLTRYETK